MEDDPASSRALRGILDRHGWRVTVVATVTDALAHLETAIPEWIILDLMLPDGDGIDVLRKVRVEGLGTSVAVTTGSSDRQRLKAVEALRPDLFLTKPIDLTELFEALGTDRRKS